MRPSQRTYALIMARDRQLFDRAFARLSRHPPPSCPAILGDLSLPQWTAFIWPNACTVCGGSIWANWAYGSRQAGMGMGAVMCDACVDEYDPHRFVWADPQAHLRSGAGPREGSISRAARSRPKVRRRAVRRTLMSRVLLCVDHVDHYVEVNHDFVSVNGYRKSDLETTAERIKILIAEAHDDDSVAVELEAIIAAQAVRSQALDSVRRARTAPDDSK